MPTGGGSSPGPGGWSTDREGGQVPVAFDEGVLRQLCDLDVGHIYASALVRRLVDANPIQQCALPLLTERIKQSLASCKVQHGVASRFPLLDFLTPHDRSQQVSMFFKARARAEEAYARSLGEMGRELHDNYSRSEGKAG
jgi:Rho GTPase-activating protein RGD1